MKKQSDASGPSAQYKERSVPPAAYRQKARPKIRLKDSPAIKSEPILAGTKQVPWSSIVHLYALPVDAEADGRYEEAYASLKQASDAVLAKKSDSEEFIEPPSYLVERMNHLRKLMGK